MFKKTASGLYSVSRAIPRCGLKHKTAICRNASTARTAKPATKKKRATVREIGLINIATVLVGSYVAYKLLPALPVMKAEAIAVSSPAAVDLKSRLSAQHVQVKNSWEHPGVYAWGNNVGRVVAPDSNEDLIKSPRRIAAFDNVLLRDLKLDRNIGVAVNEKGDIFQWGIGYALDTKEPEKTLTGKDIASVEISRDRIFALSKDGKVYSLPMSRRDQTESTKPSESSWVPGLSSESKISYRLLKPELGYFESVSKISSGRDHILILTSSGRVFSAAASYHYPSKGELGIPGLTFATRPKDKPYDTCHEIIHLSNYKITQVAAGDNHSLALDDAGRVFSFGDNTSGQLGFEYNPETNHVEVPRLLTFQGMYDTKQVVPKVKRIEAGGANSYFCVDAENIVGGKVSADLFSCGTGIFGNLGNGRWTHVQGTPTKVKALSGLFEYNDKANSIVPIRLSSLSVGATHISATMQNLTNVDASTSDTSPVHDVNFGSDVLWWGNNEFYQLGTGKRNNTSVPVYIPPLEPMVAEMMIDKASMTGSSSTGDLSRKSGIIGGKGDEVGNTRSTRKDQVHRFQAAPRKKVSVNGRNIEIEQRVACGRGNSAVYSAV